MGTIILWDGFNHFASYPSNKLKPSKFYRRMAARGSNPYAGEERIIAKGNVFEGIEAKW